MGPRSGYENGSVCRAWNTYKDVHIYPGFTFLCDTSYKQRLIDLNILPICSWHEYLEMLFVFKGICGIINLSDTVLPKTQNNKNITRSVGSKPPPIPN